MTADPTADGQGSPARRRRRGIASGRLARTILLGAAALGAALFALQRYLDLDTAELTGYLWLSLLLAALPVLAAALGFAVLWAGRALLRRIRGGAKDA